MITAEQIATANEGVKKIELKGRKYVCVFARVAAFRSLCPEGTITTDIVSLEDGVVTMKASVLDETGRLLATGYAQEKETSSFVNKTSFIENCETSAVGRALGMLGIGVDESMASAEEVANAMSQQDFLKQKATEQDISVLDALFDEANCNPVNTFPNWPDITKEDYVKAVRGLKKKLGKK